MPPHVYSVSDNAYNDMLRWVIDKIITNRNTVKSCKKDNQLPMAAMPAIIPFHNLNEFQQVSPRHNKVDETWSQNHVAFDIQDRSSIDDN